MLVRGIIWILFGVVLTLVPLVIVAAMEWNPAAGGAGFLNTLSNEELLAVAFTLGGAAAVDVLVKSGGTFRAVKVAVGGSTFVLTVVVVAAYVLLKTHSTHFTPEAAIPTVQWLYGLTVVGSLLCELLSEAPNDVAG